MNGYKVIKTAMGHRFRVKMDEDEIREKRILHAMIVLAPIVMILAFAIAGGMI